MNIVLGNGNGTFQPALIYLAGSWSDKVVLADFNGDGRTDIAIAGQVGGTAAEILLAAVPASINTTSGTPQSRLVNTNFAQIQAMVTDATGVPLANVPVTWQAPPSGASALLTPTHPRSFNGVGGGAIGTATSNAAANTTVGTYAVTATVSGLAPASFALTNTAGPAATITSISGTPQSTSPSGIFAQLQAIVKDQYGNVVPGVNVTFNAGGAGTFQGSAQATTGLDGIATSPVVKAGTSLGTFTATAKAPGVATAASFSLTVIDTTTTTTLSASPAGSVVFGHRASFLANLTPATVTGKVDFYDVTTTAAGIWIGAGPIQLERPRCFQYHPVGPGTAQNPSQASRYGTLPGFCVEYPDDGRHCPAGDVLPAAEGCRNSCS